MTGEGTGKVPLIGLVLEGQTEYKSLPEMLDRLGIHYTRPSCINGQAEDASTTDVVKYLILPHVRWQLQKNVDIVVVVVDLERRQCSAGAFRDTLRNEIVRQLRDSEPSAPTEKVRVVVCNRTFENWLLADPGGMGRSALIEKDLTRAVECHSDQKDALPLLKSAFRRKRRYVKALHGPELAKYIRVEDAEVHLCSESLREFIEIVTSLS
jgi:hypothetical protein